MATLYAGRPCCDPPTFYRNCLDRGLPTDWWGSANRFDLPIGEKAGTGKVLLRHSDLAALDQAADHDLVFSGTDRDHVVTLRRVTLTRAVCLSPGGEGQGEAVFLCDLADRRTHLARVPVDAAYNVRTADGTDYLTATKNSGSAWTWQQVVDALATACGLTPGDFALPFSPDGTPENLTYWGGLAWPALCDVLARLACAAKYDPRADAFSVVRLGSADATASGVLDGLAGERVWDAYPADPVRAWRPEKVQVQFLRRPRPTDGSTPYYSVDVTLAAAAGVVSGTYVQLKDDTAALGAAGTPSNSAALATRADERAADWLRKRSGFGRPLLKVYRDFDPDVPGSAVGSTVGRAGLSDAAGLMVTEAASSPDRLVEDWLPLDDLPPWYPEDGGSASVSSWKNVVRAATTTNGTDATAFENGDVIDGVTLATGDRILRKDQSSAAENGIFVVNASGAPTRATDADGADELVGAVVWVSEGTANGNTIWACTTDETITPGSTSTTWVKVYPPDYYPAQITSAYSSGYSWKRRTITSGAWADASAPSYPLTGTNNAYTPDDNQTLQSGQDGFVYRDSTGTKWVFIPLVLEHFPARLTSTYSSGYSWKRRTVTSGAWADHASGQTGTNNAYTPRGDTSLASGTDGYLFRDGSKWVFLPDVAAGGLAYGNGTGYDDYTVSGSASAANILVTSASNTPIVLPGHGVYRMHLTCKIHFAMPDPSSGGSGDIQSFSLMWKNNTDSVSYTDYFAASSQLTAALLSPPGDTIWDFCVAMTDDISVAAGSDASKDFYLMATSSGSGGSGTVSELRVSFLKLA